MKAYDSNRGAGVDLVDTEANSKKKPQLSPSKVYNVARVHSSNGSRIIFNSKKRPILKSMPID